MPVTFTMGPTGLSSLMWNGQEFLFAGNGAPYVVEAFANDNARGAVWLNPSPISTATTEDTVTQVYEWGEIATQYRAEGDALRMAVTIRNDWHTTLYRYRLFSLGLQYPATPTNTNNIAQFNVDGPSSLFVSYGTGAIDLVNEDPNGQLGIGLWQATSPADKQWFVQVFADPGQNINPNWPSVVRPIAPGQSVTFTIAVRFGGADATEDSLAGDIYEQYRQTFPNLIAQRPLPMKPIARLSLTGYFRPTFLKNPRGWFNDANLDVTTPEGIKNFHNGLLGSAQSSIDEMTRVGAVGCIIWDIEGQELNQSYIGDPQQAELLAPEIVGVVDEYVAKIRKAGFRVGFTLRPQQFTVAQGSLSVSGDQVTWLAGPLFKTWWPQDRAGGFIAFGVNNYRMVSVADDGLSMVIAGDAGTGTFTWRYGRQVNTIESPSPYEILQQKVQYCFSRWGATLFYVDSDLTYAGNLTPPADWEAICRQYPDVYMMPEWKGPRHYTSGYPWIDTHLGYFGPDPGTLTTYPNAAGMVRVPPDDQIASKQAELTASVQAGNTLLFDGWYPHSGNDVVIQIYKDAAA